jgi:hypothetical protein
VSYALPAKFPTLGQSDRLELLGTEGTLLVDDDHMDHLLYTEKGIPHAYVPDHQVNMAFLGSTTAGDWAVGDFWGPLGNKRGLATSVPNDRTRLPSNRIVWKRRSQLNAPPDGKAPVRAGSRLIMEELKTCASEFLGVKSFRHAQEGVQRCTSRRHAIAPDASE